MSFLRLQFHARVPSRAIACAVLLALGAHAASPAATSTTVVGATVPSATSLDASGCPARTSGVTSFGVVLPGGSFVTPDPCIVTFGSSNDTASLRVMQDDVSGNGMHRVLEPTVDTGFGTGGIGIVDIEAGADDNSFGGWTDPATGYLYVSATVGTAPTRDVAIARFLPNGMLDGSFGTGGVRTYDLGDDEGTSGIVGNEGTGELMLLGWTAGDALYYRLDLDGDPITTWEDSGALTIDLAPSFGQAVSFVRSATGGYFLASSGPGGTEIRKLDEALQLDPSWGSSGELAIAGYSCDVITPRADGSMWCNGSQLVAPGDERAAVGKVTPTGFLDTSFAGDGILEFDPGDPGSADRVFSVREAGGVIYATGVAMVGGAPNALVARMLPNGTLDPSFGTGGIFVYSLPGMLGVVGGLLEVIDDQGSLRVGGMAIDPVLGLGIHIGRLSPQLEWVPGASGSPTGYTYADLDTPGVDVTDIVGGIEVTDGDFMLTTVIDTGGTDLATGVVKLDTGTPLPDYADGTNDWNDGTSFFGVCAAQVTGAVAVADWATGACTGVDGAHWRALPTGGAAAVAAHTTGPTTVDARLDLQFGLRLADDTAPGDYVAPIRFEVVAPAT